MRPDQLASRQVRKNHSWSQSLDKRNTTAVPFVQMFHSIVPAQVIPFHSIPFHSIPAWATHSIPFPPFHSIIPQHLMGILCGSDGAVLCHGLVPPSRVKICKSTIASMFCTDKAEVAQKL